MFISILALMVLFYYVGVLVERRKWVNSAKVKNKFIEVDGKLYSVYNVRVKLKDKGD